MWNNFNKTRKIYTLNFQKITFYLVDLTISNLDPFIDQEIEEFFIRIIDLDEKEGIMTIVVSESWVSKLLYIDKPSTEKRKQGKKYHFNFLDTATACV